MTPKQRQLIRSTWAVVTPIADQAAALFYERLFTLDPDLAILFDAVEMTKQGRMLMQTLGMVVRSIDDLPAIVPVVEALGRRHAGYGVQVRHYPTVGDALLWTLQAGLGDAFTPEARRAWAHAYEILSSVMIAAAEDVERAEASPRHAVVAGRPVAA
jgi:hemoglobin-like flavoprotein